MKNYNIEFATIYVIKDIDEWEDFYKFFVFAA